MFSRVVTVILILLLAISSSWLLLPPAASARVFKQALPGYIYTFPKDHASHDDYKTEWWYFTGHLQSDSGKRYGYELTFFRTAIDSQSKTSNAWNLENIYFAHFALTDPTGHKFYYDEKLNRAGLAVAGARQDTSYVFNQLWSMELLGDTFVLKADVPDHGIHLLLTSSKKPVIHGSNGVSQKASCKGCASHYYSLTRLDTAGTLYKDGSALPVHGVSWMDHEFGSNQLTKEQVGWDWYSVQLDDNSELMLYLMRRRDGTIDPNSSGTLVNRDGTWKHLNLAQFSVKSSSTWKSPKTGGVYPMGWKLKVPDASIELEIDPLLPDQELAKTSSTGVTYWEGACDVKGVAQGKPVKGEAYVELTGYAEKFKENI